MVDQSWFEPPRRYVDIVEAIEKLREQVWYNRHQVWNEKLESGEAILIGDNEERGKDPIGLRIHRGVWEGAENLRDGSKQSTALRNLADGPISSGA